MVVQQHHWMDSFLRILFLMCLPVPPNQHVPFLSNKKQCVDMQDLFLFHNRARLWNNILKRTLLTFVEIFPLAFIFKW